MRDEALKAVSRLAGVSFVLIGAMLSAGCALSPSWAVPSCDPSLIEVTAYADKASYGPMDSPQLWFGVTNTGPLECKQAVGTDVQEWSIHAGPEKSSEVIWSSSDCSASRSDVTVRLQPGQERQSLAVFWDRTRSSPETCLHERPPVQTGEEYFYFAEVAGVATVEPVRLFLE